MAGWVHVIGFLAGAQADVSDVPIKTLFKAAMIRGILIGSRSQYVFPAIIDICVAALT